MVGVRGLGAGSAGGDGPRPAVREQILRLGDELGLSGLRRAAPRSALDRAWSASRAPRRPSPHGPEF